MIERSLSYIEFLRGKYSSIYSIDYISLLFSRFSEKLQKLMKILLMIYGTIFGSILIQ